MQLYFDTTNEIFASTPVIRISVAIIYCWTFSDRQNFLSIVCMTDVILLISFASKITAPFVNTSICENVLNVEVKLPIPITNERFVACESY